MLFPFAWILVDKEIKRIFFPKKKKRKRNIRCLQYFTLQSSFTNSKRTCELKFGEYAFLKNVKAGV